MAKNYARDRSIFIATTIDIWRLATSLVNFARKKPMGAVGALILLVMIFASIGAPLIAPYKPEHVGVGVPFSGPSLAHPMGLDQLGRDLLSRVMWGGRISLFIGLSAALASTLVGTVIGLPSAYYTRWLDLLVQRVVDAFSAFPSLILALILMAVLGQSTLNIIIAISFANAPRMSRVVRASVLSIKGQSFVESARAIGAGDARIMVNHLLPNVAATIMVLATLILGTAIVIEASLSFLGIGTSPEMPSWGRMLSGAAMEHFREHPYLAIFPGIAISLAVLAVNFLGDALRDIWDPRLRGTDSQL